jgi:predicted 3-demethylubiquinone-9 3-methyltransferase (glyoxalase superfamily)
MSNGPNVTPFLMFTGQAEEAMKLYTSLFEDSKIVSLKRYGAGEAGPEGTVYQAIFSLNGREFNCIDSPPVHAFTFTPAISLHVSCPDAARVDHYFKVLSEGGQVFMPLDRYPFADRYAWVQDRFGVSWQLSTA